MVIKKVRKGLLYEPILKCCLFEGYLSYVGFPPKADEPIAINLIDNLPVEACAIFGVVEVEGE